MRGKDRREKEEPGVPSTWIFGVHSVQETLRARPRGVSAVWIEHELNSPEISSIIRAARASGIQVRFVHRREIDRVAHGRHQGVAARIRQGGGDDLVLFLESLGEEEKKGIVLVALDQVQDPQNLGAVARSALNLGAQGLILCERRASPVTAAAVRASAGAIQKMRVFSVGNLALSLRRLKEEGFWVYGADPTGESCHAAALNTPLVLVLGSEGEGMRVPVSSICDALISIPQEAGGVQSLNVSCAASVLLYEIGRRKNSP